MGTDFSYADLDRRDLRNAAVVSKGKETIGKKPAYHLVITPKKDSQYAKLEMWVQVDNFVPVKTMMFNQAGVLLKTLQVKQMVKKGKLWFLTRSLMTNHAEKRTTELIIDTVNPRTDIPDEDLSRAALEKN